MLWSKDFFGKNKIVCLMSPDRLYFFTLTLIFLLENLHIFSRLLSPFGAQLIILVDFCHLLNRPNKEEHGIMSSKSVERCLKLSIYTQITQITLQKQTNKWQN
jgi:hypothetical protein